MPNLLATKAFRGAIALLVILSVGASCGMAVYKPSGFLPLRTVTYQEMAMAQALLQVGAGEIDSARKQIDSLLSKTPNFRLAQLVKGDLLLARTRPIETVGNAGAALPEEMAALRQEARARLMRYHLESPGNRIPRYLLQMPASYRHAIVVDSSTSTMYVFENQQGIAHYIADYYVTVGKNGTNKLKEGDKRTPVGLYFSSERLPSRQLTDFYGRAAYPISYPNEWDRRLGRSGHGIWVHGVPPDTYSRPPRASDGCVVLSNQDLEVLSKQLDLGETPVVITDGIEWVSAPQLTDLRAKMYENIELWRRDWETRNVEAYLKHYSPSFEAGKMGFKEFASQKRKINAEKSWIRVTLNDVSMFLYPGRDDLAVVNFTQNYSSNNLTNEMKKRQYWLRDTEGWRIIYEGSA
ncbi:MAG: L,D-transpeptidase family protein [Burkholderiales bacterium]